jgi:hypothetical protein
VKTSLLSLAASASTLAVLLLGAAPARAQIPGPEPVPLPPEAKPGAVIVVVPPCPEGPAAPAAPPPGVLPAYEPMLPPPSALPMVPPPPHDEGEFRRDRGFSFKLYAGPSYQRLFDSSIGSGEGGVWFGGVRGISGFYGGFDMLFGHLEHGLFTWAFRPGFTWEARLGIVHLGLGVGFNVTAIERATRADMMTGFGAGAQGFVTVDVVQGERNALFLGAKIRADVMTGQDAHGDAPVLWGPSAMIGWRYR